MIAHKLISEIGNPFLKEFVRSPACLKHFTHAWSKLLTLLLRSYNNPKLFKFQVTQDTFAELFFHLGDLEAVGVFGWVQANPMSDWAAILNSVILYAPSSFLTICQEIRTSRSKATRE